MARKKQKQSKAKQGSSNGKRQTSNQFAAEMQRLKEERKAVQDRERRKKVAARHAQIKREYRKWQSDLCWLIKNRSRVEVRSDGSAVYILPSELVKLVWQTTIDQRVKAVRAKDPSLKPHEALGKAIEHLTGEMDRLAAKAQEASGESERARAGEADGAGSAEPGAEQQDGATG